MISNSTYIVVIAILLSTGCKQLEPIEQNFFLGKFVGQQHTAPVTWETYPVLIFRTPGYGMWSKKHANLKVNDTIHRLGVGQVEVIELPVGVHHLEVRPEEGGLDFCDLKVSVNGSSGENPAYVEVFERYNPTGQMLSMIVAEIEAITKYPLEPDQACFGRFGLVQGLLPEGTDLMAPLTTQTAEMGPSPP